MAASLPASRAGGDQLQRGQLALIQGHTVDGAKQGLVIVQVTSSGNPLFPQVAFLAAEDADYNWFISKPGGKDRVR